MSQSPRPVERFDDLLEKFDHAMLVSVADDGGLHARPMAIAATEDGGKLYFATSSESVKTDEIAREPRVTATMQKDSTYLAISGTATLLADARRARDLWTPAWQLWFPQGPDDPRLVLLELEPERAEYWDRSGLRQLEFLWEAGKAVASGTVVDDENLSGHGRIEFGNRASPEASKG